MATDPFIAPELADTPRQEPNLTPGVSVPPARPWRTGRPGDAVANGQPEGPLLGNPGPNVGFAVKLVHHVHASLQLAVGEHDHDVEAVLSAIAMKRAAAFGRAPMIDDVRIAGELLGYLDPAPADFVTWRVHAVHDAGHSYPVRRSVVDGIDEAYLKQPAAKVREAYALARHRLQHGWPGPDLPEILVTP
ncbi:MAG: hypothetical protein ACOYN3_01275 [Acidimicrobiia bacterium]